MTACLRLDDYLDGRLSDADAEAFETHALDCAACDAALETSAVDLSSLRDVTCPPALVEAALRPGRRAGDRGPAVGRGLRRRFVWAPLALAAALAIVVGVSLDRASAPPEVAEGTAPAQTTESPEAGEVAADQIEAPALAPVAEAVPVAPTPRATPERSTPRPDRRPAVSPVAPPAPAVAPAVDVAQATPEAPDEAEPTADEIAAARQDLALAFRLVADAQSRAGDAVRAEAGPLSHTLDQALPF